MKARSRSIHLSVHIHKDPAAMAERAAHILAAACEEAVAERGVFRIALSGGQTPIPLFRLLAASDWADRLPWDKMNFFWVDERCVGPDHPDSNYGLARRELLSHVPATHFYRMRGDIDPVEAAVKYEQQIRIVKEVMHSRKVNPDIHSLVKGVMIESYIEEGNQKIGEGVYGKSITDPCLGWADSEKLLYELAELNV